jgi:hypothetical protein
MGWQHGILHGRDFHRIRFHANGIACAIVGRLELQVVDIKTEKSDHRTTKVLAYKLNEVVISFHLEQIFIFRAPQHAGGAYFAD